MKSQRWPKWRANTAAATTTHMRNEGDLLLEAIDEALLIGRKAKTPVHIYHLKTAGRQNWGKMPLAIARIKAARADGEQVTADIYPYINNGLSLESFVNPRHFTNGRARFIERLKDDKYRAEIRKEMETTSRLGELVSPRRQRLEQGRYRPGGRREV